MRTVRVWHSHRLANSDSQDCRDEPEEVRDGGIVPRLLHDAKSRQSNSRTNCAGCSAGRIPNRLELLGAPIFPRQNTLRNCDTNRNRGSEVSLDNSRERV